MPTIMETRDDYGVITYANEDAWYITPYDEFESPETLKIIISSGLAELHSLSTDYAVRLATDSSGRNEYLAHIRATVTKMPAFSFSSYRSLQSAPNVLMTYD